MPTSYLYFIIENKNRDIIIYIFPKNEIDIRNQNIIIISHKNMISLLDQKNSKQFGIDMTYKIIPRSYIPYNLLSLYAINKFNDTIGIGALICLKYNDKNLWKKYLQF